MEFQVGDWTAIRSTNELVKGTTRVRLEGRAMEVLQLLHESGGEVVSKNDLIDAVWKLQVVSDHSITVVISDLRKALGDNPREPRYIETIPKKGYRLILRQPDHAGGVEGKAAASITTKAANFTWLFVAMLMLLFGFWFALDVQDRSSPDSVKLIVLDATNSTNDPSVDALASSITELTLDGMSRAKNVELVRWRRLPASTDDDKHNAGAVILETRIIDAEDSRLLAMTIRKKGSDAIFWTTTEPVSLRHFRLAQDRALRDLSAELGLGELPSLRPVFSAVAEELFWRARYLWNSRQRSAAVRAQNLLTEVLEMEPGYFKAHAALADLYSHKTGGFFNGVLDDPLALARFHVERAADIQPAAIEVLLARGHIALFADGDPEQALAYLTDVVDRAPNSATAWVSYANALAASGQFSAAVDAINRAQRADPMDPSVLLDKVWILLLARQYDEALAAAGAAEKLGMSVSLYRGLVFGAAGEHDIAVEGWLGFLGQSIPTSTITQISQAASAGNYPEAYEIIANTINNHERLASPVISALAFGLAENYTRTREVLSGLSGSDKNWVELWARHVPIISRAYNNDAAKPE